MHCSNNFKHFFLLGMIIVNSCHASPRSEQLLKQVRHKNIRSSGVNSLESMFTQCCSLGMSWVDEKRPCEVAVSPPVSGIPVDLQTPCLVTASICCLRSSRIAMCELGKVDAMDGHECLRSVLPGGEYRKDCCDSCKIGLMTGSRGESCSFSTFGFEYPWDEGFADCCQISKLSSGGISLPDVNENNEVQDGRCGANNPCEHLCKDTGHAIECSCQSGYQLEKDGKSCVDIDECVSGFHLCDHDLQQCVNTEGSYFCLSQDGSRDYPRTRALESGGATFSPAHVPRPLGSSSGTSGGACPIGYDYNPATRTCDDVNECKLNIDSCDRRTHNCQNTQGSYLCIEQPSPQCAPDINECADGLDYCNREREYCVNTNGGYECQPKTRSQCPAGYKYNSLLLSCEDINECDEPIPPCKHCINTEGAYVCGSEQQCPAGYKSGLHGVCEDVNECLENLDDCDKVIDDCINEIGSYRCDAKANGQQKLCASGYRFDTRQNQCADVNECIENLHTCDVKTHLCINTEGSFRCQRLSVPLVVKTLMNVLLEPITVQRLMNVKIQWADYLQIAWNRLVRSGTSIGFRNATMPREGTHTCDPEKEVCINKVGGFVCRALVCPSGYRPNLIARTCVDINECEESNHNCTINQECINRIGGFYCQTIIIRDCPLGYKFDLLSKSCKDIDECLESLNNCPPSHTCVNIPGNFVCHAICQPGFINDPNDPRQCKDIDECAEGIDACNRDRETCINSVGSYRCVSHKLDCEAGYQFDSSAGNCVDIDECAESRHNCYLPSQICVNTQGAFECVSGDIQECSQGYRFDPSSESCIDVNECQTGEQTCTPSQRCDNTIGSYTCVRTTGCGTGYTLNAQTGNCEDDDECELGLDNCGSLHSCHNNLGSFRCVLKVCPAGFRLESNGLCLPIVCTTGFEIDATGSCVDINECTQSNICPFSYACVNSIGSYKCEKRNFCGDGFEVVGTRCVDVDECTRGTHKCRAGQTCVNRQGNYACQCPIGYLMNSRRECEDECARYGRICTDNGICENTPGSYICRCNSGFTQSGDGKTCIDVDECEASFVCHQKCINTWGSYQCACNQGYTLAEDSRTCQDIDECSLWRGRGHLCIGICVNEPGSYTCNCPDGYKLGADKRTCHDINECSQPNICRQENEVCLNTRGGYRCNEIVCPANYIRDTEHKTSDDDHDFSVTCHKQCISSNIACMLNNTNSITRQFTSRPSFPVLNEPLTIVHMKAIVKQSFQNDFYVDIQLEDGIFNYLFDVISDKEQGSLRLIFPITGPLSIELRIVMRLIVHSNIVASKHLIFVYLDIAKYRF
uniref:EGF-like domain-containing protein n=1 Tax=Strigamia maritima TaxID=126957 RepID=T1IWC6_STRMM